MKKLAYSILTAAVAVALSACGDEVTKVTKVEENHEARVVESLSSIDCSTTGEMAFNRADSQLYICAWGEWLPMKGRDGADGQDGSSSSSATNESCITRHISMMSGMDGVEVVCGDTRDTLWSSNIKLCGDSIYDISKRFCDRRDNRLYRWVRIGDQIWMAENLKFGSIISASFDQGDATADSAQYYGLSGISFDNFGALYQWHTAMGFAQSYDGASLVSKNMIQKPHRGICPEGWHIPDSTEWIKLYDTVDPPQQAVAAGTGGAQKLKSKFIWTGSVGAGTDDYGFNGLPAGSRTTDKQIVGYGSGEDKYTYWWSTNMDGNTMAWAAGLLSDDTKLSFYYGAERQSGLSVRCINDLDLTQKSQTDGETGGGLVYLPGTVGGCSAERTCW